MLETTASQEDREVLGGMAAAVAEIAAQEDCCLVEKSGVAFLGLLELSEQVPQRLHGFYFDDLELLKFAWVLAVVREVVMAESHARDRRGEAGAGKHDGD